jgi:hypothetical protein
MASISLAADLRSCPSVTPPNAIGLANGIAQSIVSLARCIGPVIGGYVSCLVSTSSTADPTNLALVGQCTE